MVLKRIFSPKNPLYDFSSINCFYDTESDFISELKSYQTFFESGMSIAAISLTSRLKTFGWLVNCFGKAKGFDAIYGILSKSQLDCNELPVIIRLIKTVANLVNYLDYCEWQSHCLIIAEAGIIYLKAITDIELKKISEKHLKKLIEQIRRLYIIDGVIPKTQEIDTLELEIAWRLCTLPSIERQLVGIGIINDIVVQLNNSKNKAKTKILLNWLTEKNFEAIVIGESIQVEKMQKGFNILRFMYIERLIGGNGLLQIWDDCLSKSNNVPDVMHNAFKELSLHFTTKIATKLFERIKQVPLSDYTFNTIDLLISLAKNEYYRNKKLSLFKEDESSDFPTHTIPFDGANNRSFEDPPEIPEDETENYEPLFEITTYLWNLVQEKALSHGFSLEIQAKATESYLQFLSFYYPKKLVECLEICGDMIAKDQSVLHFAKIYTQIRDLLKEHNQSGIAIKDLSQAVIINIIQFKCKAVQKGIEHENDLTDFYETFITYEIQKLSYYSELERRLNLLQYLLANNSQKTQFRHFNKLLEAFTTNGISGKEIDIFLQFILYILGLSQGLFFIAEGAFDSFFFDFLLKIDTKAYSSSAFQCLKELFIGMNEIYRHIELSQIGDLEIISPELIGLNAIWEIALDAQDQKVQKSANDLLFLIYKIKKPYKEERRVVYESFVTKCMSYVKSAIDPNNPIENSHERIIKVLKLLIKQIEISEERSFEKLPKQILMSSFIVNAIGSYNKRVSIQVNPIMTVSELLKKVKSEAYSSSTKYAANGVVLTSSENTLYESNITQPYTLKAASNTTWESNLQYSENNNNEIKQDDEEKINESSLKKIRVIFQDNTLETIKEALIRSNYDTDLAIERMTEKYWVDKFIDYAEDRKKEKIQQSSNRKPEQLSFLLANNNEFFQILYNLLDSTNLEIAQNSWNLLSNIPINSKMINDAFRFNLDEKAKEFKYDSHYKILYNLHILRAIMDFNNLSPQEWIENFVLKGRFVGVCENLLNFPCKSMIMPETFEIRMQILEYIFNIYEIFVEIALDELNHSSYNDLVRKRNANGYAGGNTFKDFVNHAYFCKKEANLILDVLKNSKIVETLIKILVQVSIEKSGTTSIILAGASLLNTIFCLDHYFIIEAEKDENFAELIKNILIYSTQNDMKTTFITQLDILFSLFEENSWRDNEFAPPNVFCLNLLITTLPLPIDENANFDSYFRFVAKHIKLVSSKHNSNKIYIDQELSKYISFDKTELVSMLAQFIKAKSLQKIKTPAENKLLNGYISLFAELLDLDKELFEKVKPKIESDLLEHLCYTIFGDSGKSSIKTMRIYSKDIVPVICKLLLACAKQSNEMLLKIFWSLVTFHDKIPKNLIKELEQNIGEIAESGYVGLKNLGCTCYINSLLQQIFMMPVIKNQILEIPTSDLEKIKGDNVILNLQKIFTNLQCSKQSYFIPEDFCKNFKDYEGKPIDVRVQQDVGEFFNALADKMESELKSLQFKQFFRDDMEIEINSDFVSAESDLKHLSEKEEKHLCLPLDIKGKKNIQEALDYLVKEEILEGDNKYFCSEQNKLIRATKKCTFKKLPNTVILNLKRFEYDKVSKLRKKLNDYCEFPEMLNFFKWTTEGQKNHSEEKPRALDYDLVGVLIHTGTAEGGHYFSYCKERNANSPKFGKWFEFNDTRVAPFDIADLKFQAFGVVDTNKAKAMNEWENDSNAYLLVYQKAEQIIANKEAVIVSKEKYEVLVEQENENKTNARIVIYCIYF